MEENEDTIILDDANVDTGTESPQDLGQQEDTNAQTQQPQHSESELKAMEQGWNPDKDSYEKANPGKKWRPAEDYLERGELYDTIHNLKRTVETQKEKFETLEHHYQKVREHTKSQVEKELRQQLREATELGDVDAINRITDEIVNVKTQQDDAPANNNNTNPYANDPAVNDFKTRNGHWYTEDPTQVENFAISVDAAQYENVLAQTRKELSTAERLRLTQEYVKFKYPQKFVNPNQSKPAAVAAATSIAPTKKTEIKISDLPVHHQRVIRTLKPESQKQYIADLKVIGEI
jgi:hypothetical protein